MTHLVTETKPCCSAPADAVDSDDWKVLKGDTQIRYAADRFENTGLLGAIRVPVAGRIYEHTPAELLPIKTHRWVRHGEEYALWHWDHEKIAAIDVGGG